MIKDTYENECYLCGKYGAVDVHHIFEGCTRKVCDEDGLTTNLCRKCHTLVHGSKGDGARQFLHRIAQEEYEETHTREEFIKRYIKSYL